MTESEWLTGDDVRAMLSYLSGKTTRRKRLLMGCAAVRLWFDDLLVSEQDVNVAVAMTEAYAEDDASDAEWERAVNLPSLKPNPDWPELSLDE